MKSISPFGDQIEYFPDNDEEINKIKTFINNSRKNVVIQGLGFVGAAMAAALSSARDSNGGCLYNVIGVDLPDEKNFWKISLVNSFKPPVVSTDKALSEAYTKAGTEGNLMATFSDFAYSVADVIVIDIHLDIKKKAVGVVKDYEFTYGIYKKALESVAAKAKEDVLVIVETTVPPGTTDKLVYPVFQKAFAERGLDISKLYVSHSYERVMPGPNYYNSIVNFYRVFSAVNEKSKEKAREFFESFINTGEYPLTELHSTNASETAKVLENSFRAMNIAFIKEWTAFAHSSEINLFEVIDAIRVRPTHKNIMQPGFGVGGYCLTKDALLADWAFRNNFGNDGHLNMSVDAISTNDLMPGYTLQLIQKYIPDLKDRKIAILGISYISDVSDTRYSPTEYFYNLCEKEGAKIIVHDTMVSDWEEKKISIDTGIESLSGSKEEIVVFAVKHREYSALSAEMILKLFPDLKLLVDANNVISDITAKEISLKGISVAGVGKGHWVKLNNIKK